MNDYWIPYWGALVLKTRIDESLINKLLDEGNKSRLNNQDASKSLVGQIKHEYYYKDFDDWILPYLDHILSMYSNKVQESDWLGTSKASMPLSIKKLSGLWINYQQAHEYNPIHNHTGELSFIIYLQMPNEIKKENEKDFVKGSINFLNSSYAQPFSKNLLTLFPEVGDFFLFPSWLLHYVNAFESDVERISVSGNIILKSPQI